MHPYHGDSGGDGGVRLMVVMVGDGSEGGVGGVVEAATEVVAGDGDGCGDVLGVGWWRLEGGRKRLRKKEEGRCGG
ncbi:hypothetical protein Tco_0706976 [Tanacetum coccineum]|uniref:Uncharacterized protein n=1 Tax=Tanacetum coccineum TaxID=301880 RepID=A0ABQ4Y9R2_9ASTR